MVDFKVLESERLGKVRCAILEEQGILFVEDDIIDIISKYGKEVNSDIEYYSEYKVKYYYRDNDNNDCYVQFVKSEKSYELIKEKCGEEISNELKRLTDLAIENHKEIDDKKYTVKYVIDIVKDRYNKTLTAMDIIKLADEYYASFVLLHNDSDYSELGFTKSNVERLLFGIAIKMEFDNTFDKITK